jgi:hypothetical protein
VPAARARTRRQLGAKRREERQLHESRYAQ